MAGPQQKLPVWWLWLLLLLLLLPAQAPAQASSSETPVKFETPRQAMDFIVQQHHQGAPKEQTMAALHQLLEQAPAFDPAARGLASMYFSSNRFAEAEQVLRNCISAGSPSHELWNDIGFAMESTGREGEAEQLYRQVAAAQPQFALPWFNLANLLSHQGRHTEALVTLQQFVSVNPASADGYYRLGVTKATVGDVLGAAAAYSSALARDVDHPEARVNIAALHFQYGAVEDAIVQGEWAVKLPRISRDLLRLAYGNLAQAYEIAGRIDDAFSAYRTSVELQNTVELRLTVMLQWLRAERTIVLWRMQDQYLDGLLAEVRLFVNAQYVMVVQGPRAHTVACDSPGHHSPLLPFDSLQLPVDPMLQRLIAERQSAALVLPIPAWAYPQSHQPLHALVVGYATFDYNEHPTAHMVEGLFVHHNRTAVHVVAISYGKDDGSDVRRRIKSSVDRFEDVVTLSYQDAVNRIASLGTHILVDMQGHTRGVRSQLMALKPAPIVVNYLVYPGTSGSPFIDYLVADRHVTPPEHAGYYTEKLLLLPRTYQVNYYKTLLHNASHSAPPLREEVGLPPTWMFNPLTAAMTRRIVFVNFNKVNKHDPTAFHAWMSILHRAPQAVLWLTSTTDATGDRVTQNFKAQAAACGISPSRIIVLPRVNKVQHLLRQVHADLFLDSFPYGAHSTATDALRQSVPVLTLAGPAFASRVGITVLHSVNTPFMVTHGIKQFVDTAVHLAHNPHVLDTLKHQLRHRLQAAAPLPSIFDGAGYSAAFERGLRMAWDVHTAGEQPRHLLVASGD